MLGQLRKKGVRRIVFPLIVSLLSLGVFSSAQAAIITPGQMVKAQSENEHLANVQSFLARDDVRQNLEALGVSPADASERAAQLSAEELAELSGEIDELPAGGVLAALGVVLVVLIVLELLGVTNIFTAL